MMKRNRNAISAGLLAASVIAAVPGCKRLEDMSALLSDRRHAFSRLQVGTQGATREQVIDAMGQPQSMRTFGLIGIGQGEMLAFVDASNQYLVLVVNDRAVMKHAAPRGVEKAQEVRP